MNASSTQELQNLTAALKSIKNRRLLERYHAVKFFLEGHSISHIAKIIGRSRSTVRFYIRAYASAGIVGLGAKIFCGTTIFSDGLPTRTNQAGCCADKHRKASVLPPPAIGPAH